MALYSCSPIVKNRDICPKNVPRLPDLTHWERPKKNYQLIRKDTCSSKQDPDINLNLSNSKKKKNFSELNTSSTIATTILSAWSTSVQQKQIITKNC